MGSTNNTNAATTAQTGASPLLASYATLVYLPPGDVPANIIVFNQAGTIQTLGTDPQVNMNFTVTDVAGVTGATGATGVAGATPTSPTGCDFYDFRGV